MEGVEEQLCAVFSILREDGGHFCLVKGRYDHVLGLLIHDAVDVLQVLRLGLHVGLEEVQQAEHLSLALRRLLLEVDYKLIVVALNLLKLEETLLVNLASDHQPTDLLFYLLVA